MECEEIQKNIEELQQAMATAPVLPPTPPAPTPAANIQLLQQAAASMLQELATTDGADPTHIAMAETLSKQLVDGFRGCLEHAQQVQAQKEPPPHRRLNGKQPRARSHEPPDVAMRSAVHTRVNGKQPTRTTLSDFWPGASRTVLKSAFEKRAKG